MVFQKVANFLIVDDSRIMRSMIKNCVSQIPQIEEVLFHDAANGVEAYMTLQTEDIDMILLDWNMPRLNGIELLKKLRSEKKFKRIPIIMITSEAAKYNIVEAVKEGVDDYIIKPFRESVLMNKIRKHI